MVPVLPEHHFLGVHDLSAKDADVRRIHERVLLGDGRGQRGTLRALLFCEQPVATAGGARTEHRGVEEIVGY